MTRKTLQSNFKVVELAQDAAFLATLNHLSACPPAKTPGPRDPTTIINDEGRLQGWLECVAYLRNIHSLPPPEPATKPLPYSQPAETPNK